MRSPSCWYGASHAELRGPMPSGAQGTRQLAPLQWRRRAMNVLALLATALAALLVLIPLFVIFAYLLYRGAGSLSWSFFTQPPAPVGETGGGMGNAIVGSGILLGLACVIGIPIGIGAGVFLSEFGHRRLGNIVRFTADVLNGVPSIVIGMAVYGLLVAHWHFSAYAGGLALGIMMVPTITRSTETMLL